jgi:hypothetical protein
MNEFRGIEGIDGWSKKLNSMLAEAKQIASKEALGPRLKMSERLTDFILESRPNTPEIQMLDKIAETTAAALLADSIEKRLKAITSRTGEFIRLTKEFDAQAMKNEENAESIRLENIIATVDSATETVNAAKKLKESLKDNVKEGKIAELIDETVTAVEKLRSNLGKLL